MWFLQVGLLLLHTVFVTLSTAFVCNSGSINPIRKEMAADVLQLNNIPCKYEFSNAHQWCTKHKSDSNYSVSSVCPTQHPESIDYLVLFRRKQEVFTVSGLVRLHEDTSLSTSDVFLMLRKQHNTKGYLQLHELKTWGTGRYPTESFLEDMMFLEFKL